MNVFDQFKETMGYQMGKAEAEKSNQPNEQPELGAEECTHPTLNSGYWKDFCSECGVQVRNPQCGTCGHPKSDHFDYTDNDWTPKHCCDGCDGFNSESFYELKACPFCGRAPREMNPTGIYFSIGCVCGIIITRDTRAEVVAAWNTRGPDERVKRLEVAESDIDLLIGVLNKPTNEVVKNIAIEQVLKRRKV